MLFIYFTAGAGASLIGNAWASFFSGIGGAMMSGAIAVFVSGFIMTGSLSGTVKGAISAGVAYGIGDLIKGAEFLKKATSFTKESLRAVLHGITRAAITKAQGGRWNSGFWSGLTGSALGTFMGTLGKVNIAIKTVINSIASGLISK